MLCDFHERTRVLQCLAVCMICMQRKRKKKKVKRKGETQEKKKGEEEKRIEVLSTVNDAVRYPHRKKGGGKKKAGKSRRLEIVLPFTILNFFIVPGT